MITGNAYRKQYLASGINFILDISIPVRNSNPQNEPLKHYKSLSYETLAVSWLLNDGWDVFLPMIDHGLKIDFVIYFSRVGNWEYIKPPFRQRRKRLNPKGHVRFHQHPKYFNLFNAFISHQQQLFLLLHGVTCKFYM